MTRRTFLAGAAAAGAAAAAPAARSAMGLSPDCFVVARAPSRDPLAYLQYGYERGAGGVQAYLNNFDPAYIRQVREKVEQLGMYLEITAMMPRDDNTELFEKTIEAAKECGAKCMRSVCLSGRRYETFNTLEQWNTFVEESHARLARTAKLMEKHRMPIGIENHKDWTLEEMVPLLQKYGGEYLGVCFDWGNNLSLLDDPVALAEGFAPYIMSCHIKDMAVEEYPDGFLLSEVALGRGFLELKRMTDIIRKARPNAHFSLDMLTRDPLKVTCLTDKYWLTMGNRGGKYLARTLRMVRENKPSQPLARVSRMERQAALELEQNNVLESVAYARDELGLRI